MGVSENEVYPPVVAIFMGKLMINQWSLGHLIFRQSYRGDSGNPLVQSIYPSDPDEWTSLIYFIYFSWTIQCLSEFLQEQLCLDVRSMESMGQGISPVRWLQRSRFERSMDLTEKGIWSTISGSDSLCKAMAVTGAQFIEIVQQLHWCPVSFPLKYLGQWEAACQWSIAYIALEGDTNGILGTWGWLSTLGPSADSNCKIYWFETDTSLMRIWCHCMSLQPVFKLGSPEMHQFCAKTTGRKGYPVVSPILRCLESLRATLGFPSCAALTLSLHTGMHQDSLPWR